MNVHNIMEEYVSKNVNELYDELVKEKTPWLTCDCETCRMDSISYVLNRIQPRYIVSGRGAVYTTQILDDGQLKADVHALSIEAIRVISSVQRPYHKITSKVSESNKNKNISSPVFNFPVISGAVYDGDTFAPLIDAEITLLDKNGIVMMHDFSWPNPTKTFKSTKGSFSFWPNAETASKAGEAKKFSFTIEAKAEGYSTAKQGFEIILMSESEREEKIKNSLTMKIQDIILFKE